MKVKELTIQVSVVVQFIDYVLVVIKETKKFVVVLTS
jgi:hypothetical protein